MLAYAASYESHESRKDDKKIKECGEEIVDAASDNEPYFEPEQVVQMPPVNELGVWLLWIVPFCSLVGSSASVCG